MMEALFASFRVFDFAVIELHHVMHFQAFLRTHMREIPFLEAVGGARVEPSRGRAAVERRGQISWVSLIWLILSIRFVIIADFSF